MRRVSHLLLTLEAIALVVLTVIAGAFLLAGSGSVWMSALTGEGYVDALVWTIALLSLAAAWWLLLAYFYGGHKAAQGVPVVIWVFAGLVALLALSEPALSGEGFGFAILFVPTFLHLSAEVWVWPPDTAFERTPEK
jgi:hypothetical protein